MAVAASSNHRAANTLGGPANWCHSVAPQEGNILCRLRTGEASGWPAYLVPAAREG
jgi:hypothetical protein